jgi:hypothetical protein
MSRSSFLSTVAVAFAASCTTSGFAHAQQPASKIEEPESSDFLTEFLRTIENGWIAAAIKPDPNDSPLRKLQKERCREQAIYLKKVKELIAIGRFNAQDYTDYINYSASVVENVLELVGKTTDKLKCLELQVELAKISEKFTETRVAVGSDPSHVLNFARAARMDAEIRVLKYKAEIEKHNLMTGRPAIAQIPSAFAPEQLATGMPYIYQSGTAAWYQPLRTYPMARWSPSTGWTYPGATWSSSTGWTFPNAYPLPGRIFLGGG